MSCKLLHLFILNGSHSQGVNIFLKVNVPVSLARVFLILPIYFLARVFFLISPIYFLAPSTQAKSKSSPL